MWQYGALFVLWLLSRAGQNGGQAAQPVTAPKAKTEPSYEKDAKPDDLTRIRGIGKKSALALQRNGIRTLAQLADADVDHLRAILEREGLPSEIVDPSEWPARAKEAA